MTEIQKSELEIYLSKYIVKESWVISNLPNLYIFFNDRDGSALSEKIYLYLNDGLDVGKCKSCKNQTQFLSIKRGYRTYCSKTCSNNDIELNNKKLESFKKNFMEKWGVDNPMKNEEIKKRLIENQTKAGYKKRTETFKKNFLEKWGVDNPSKLKSVKEKKSKTTLKNWGVENPFQNEAIKKQIKNTLLGNFGVSHPAHSDEIKKKKKETILKNFGVDNPMKSPEIKNKFKETCLEKWGVYHISKSDIIKNKIKRKIINEYNNFFNSNNFYLEMIDIKDTFHLNCKKCGKDFTMHKSTLSVRKRFENEICIHCNPLKTKSSFFENSLYDFISEIYKGEIIKNHKIDKKEIDIYLPVLKIGFEFNGVYWHSTKFKDKSYHSDKLKHFEDKNIRIFQIWEDDWILKREILKSMIGHKLGNTNTKIGARECDVRIIEDNKLVRDFLENNHIQGFVGSKIKLGLFYRNELVSLMTFGELRKSLGQKSKFGHWELLRFCNKIGYNVVGSATKLFKRFIKRDDVNEIISYSKNDYSDGKIYKILDFEFVGETVSNYYYVIGGKRVGRFNFRKDKLVKEGADPNLTEEKIMESKGYFKIFDSGNKKWFFSKI
jgi:hypothetical protein